MNSRNSHRIGVQRSLFSVAYRFVDAAVIAGTLAAAAVHSPPQPIHNWVMAGLVAVVLFYLLAEVTGATPDRELVCLTCTWGLTVLGLVVVDTVCRPPLEYTRRSLFVWSLAAPAAMALCRVLVCGLMRVLRARGLNTRRFAIVGVNPLGIELARNIEASSHLGLKLVGFYDDRPAERTVDLPSDVGARVGGIAELVQQARSGDVHRIYITFPMRAEKRIRNVLDQLSDTTASVYLVPDFFVFQLLHSRWTNINGLPVVSVFENPLLGVDGLVKRIVDVVLASVALVLMAVPMAVIAILIKRSSPGPIFFRQRRYGLDGREILVWKFRTMRVCEDGDRVVQAQQDDPRVTPIGKLLRATSLDELPQLFNVLGGSMSLVGPRPHATAHNEHYRKLVQGYMLRHKVKPGITGLAQVNGWRGETDTLEKMEKRIQCDHQYIRQWSLWLDIKILFRTIFVVLSRQNAY